MTKNKKKLFDFKIVFGSVRSPVNANLRSSVCPVISVLELIIVKPKSEVPKSRPKGLGLTLKSHGPPPHPTHPPLTFKHEGGLW